MQRGGGDVGGGVFYDGAGAGGGVEAPDEVCGAAGQGGEGADGDGVGGQVGVEGGGGGQVHGWGGGTGRVVGGVRLCLL